MSSSEPLDIEESAQVMKVLADTFDRVGALVQGGRLTPVLEAIPAAAVESVGNAQFASVTLLQRGTFRSVAPTDECARKADELQYELGSGPCVDAVLEDAVYCPQDLEHDDRWPTYGRRVVNELGVRSMMSFRLGSMETGVESGIAGLNLYSKEVGAFDEADRWTGLILATHATALVAAAVNAERADHLQVALETNREIGAAIGILMATRKLSQEAAFAVLRVASQDTNRKLSVVAAEVVSTGQLQLSPRARGPRAEP